LCWRTIVISYCLKTESGNSASFSFGGGSMKKRLISIRLSSASQLGSKIAYKYRTQRSHLEKKRY
jgi:hypothetical protein